MRYQFDMSKEEGKLPQPRIYRLVPPDNVTPYVIPLTPNVTPFNDYIELRQREYALESFGYFWKLVESKKI